MVDDVHGRHLLRLTFRQLLLFGQLLRLHIHWVAMLGDFFVTGGDVLALVGLHGVAKLLEFLLFLLDALHRLVFLVLDLMSSALISLLALLVKLLDAFHVHRSIFIFVDACLGDLHALLQFELLLPLLDHGSTLLSLIKELLAALKSHLALGVVLRATILDQTLLFDGLALELLLELLAAALLPARQSVDDLGDVGLRPFLWGPLSGASLLDRSRFLFLELAPKHFMTLFDGAVFLVEAVRQLVRVEALALQLLSNGSRLVRFLLDLACLHELLFGLHLLQFLHLSFVHGVEMIRMLVNFPGKKLSGGTGGSSRRPDAS
mmetsp:Transcript_54041/g.115408  ORF Transcript_54041/g.115408 Transcript_54041/m.115408 type:complete len:319 (-) Transcript_54041:447-1403(-)